MPKATCRQCNKILRFSETYFSTLGSYLRVNLLNKPGLDKLAVVFKSSLLVDDTGEVDRGMIDF